ncbi:hypothetical protein P8452_09416 [Trifolium repens]|nr:hypothetical protein P8452_09416 [Trifolium repens]
MEIQQDMYGFSKCNISSLIEMEELLLDWRLTVRFTCVGRRGARGKQGLVMIWNLIMGSSGGNPRSSASTHLTGVDPNKHTKRP